jgi:hypothetical protein
MEKFTWHDYGHMLLLQVVILLCIAFAINAVYPISDTPHLTTHNVFDYGKIVSDIFNGYEITSDTFFENKMPFENPIDDYYRNITHNNSIILCNLYGDTSKILNRNILDWQEAPVQGHEKPLIIVGPYKFCEGIEGNWITPCKTSDPGAFYFVVYNLENHYIDNFCLKHNMKLVDYYRKIKSPKNVDVSIIKMIKPEDLSFPSSYVKYSFHKGVILKVNGRFNSEAKR